MCIWWEETIWDLWGGLYRWLFASLSKEHVPVNGGDVWVFGDELCWIGIFEGEGGDSGGFEQVEDSNKVWAAIQIERVPNSVVGTVISE